MTLTRTIAAAIAVLAGCVGQVHAQSFPSRPVTMIVPFPAGGPSDTLARILGERMRTSLGQTVIVENITGAGASIGVARGAQAAPDGYTITIGNWTSHVGAGAMYPAVHDALLEIQPLSLISATPLMIIGKNDLPPKDARQRIARAAGWKRNDHRDRPRRKGLRMDVRNGADRNSKSRGHQCRLLHDFLACPLRFCVRR